MIIKSPKLSRRSFFKGSLIAIVAASTVSLTAYAQQIPLEQKVDKWKSQRQMALLLMAGIMADKLTGQEVEQLCLALDPVLMYVALRWARYSTKTVDQYKAVIKAITGSGSRMIADKIMSLMGDHSPDGRWSNVNSIKKEFDKDDSIIVLEPHQIVDWTIEKLKTVEV